MRTVMKQLWVWFVIVAAGISLVRGRYASLGLNQKRYPTPDGKGFICGDIDIRNEVRFFKQLENCTVIEGHLQILLIEGATQEEYRQLQFPDLVEITDYFLLYRVYGLKTLSHIFPNLSVIRGQRLFFNFALVAYEMMDLEELGLWGLTTIERGAVRLEKNPLLCYVDTVDWSKIAVGIRESSDHFFKANRNVKECVNMCSEKCPVTPVHDKKTRRCWTLKHCQRILTCDRRKCASGMCDNGVCCDENCVGGCSGTTSRDCTACKNVINVSNNQTICATQCLPGTYEYRRRRCLREDECINTKNKLVKSNHTSTPGICAETCPSGYIESETDHTMCVKCANRCPKGCPSKRVDNVKTAQELKGCTVIEGHLEIRIKKGSNIGQELEQNLGQIEEVKGHLWIHSSDALLSLNFLKSLKKIHGQALADRKYALLVNDNVNLQELFTEEVTNNLQILNGNMIFHYNRKLCVHKIREFEKKVQMSSDKSKNDISDSTNGDHMPCKVSTLNLTVVRVSSRIAFLRWQNFKLPDARHLFGYIINYKEAPHQNVSIYDGRDACSEDIWNTKDVLNKSDKEEEYVSNIIVSLKPWTQYAVYIQTYTTSSAEYGAMSKLVYFWTAPAYPTVPVNLRVKPIMNGSLYVSWDPPTHPNGNVTHYSVYWRRRPLVAEKLYERNYCQEPLFAKGEETEIEKEERKKNEEKDNTKTNTTGSTDQCACPKTKEQQTEEENERLMQIEFENYLHNFVYIKRRDSRGKKRAKLNRKKATSLFKNTSNSTDPTDNQGGDKQKRRKRDSPPAERYRREAQTQYNTTKLGDIVLDKDNNDTKDETREGRNGSDSEGPYYTVVVENLRNIVITNLGHFEDYNIEVIACQERDPRDPQKEKLCSSRAITMARTLPDKDADNIDPNSIMIKELKNQTGEVIVTWEAPKNPNGLIVIYQIQYSKVLKNIQPTLFCITHTDFNRSQSYRINKLEPGNYSVQIRATSLAGRGNFTAPKYFTITDRSGSPTMWPQETIIAVSVSAVFLLILMVVIAVWFVARSRFSKVPDYATHISANPEYMQGEIYQKDEWEVDRDKIKLIRELGQGSFGMVYEGLAINLFDSGEEIKVAVKTVNEHASFSERMSFLNEASIMKASKCNHVVRLLGVVSEGQPPFVIMELMENGDLKNFLRMHRPDEEEMESTFALIKSSKTPRQPPSLKQIIKMAGEIADGMAYLADKKFVHRDLAARNCMVAGDLTVKIGDFGMTRDIYETDYYRKGGKALLPVRWMAPESLKDGIFTSLSDVWSYGVVLWEMATLAAQPYQGLSNEEVLKYVLSGKRMDKPDGCPESLFNLMYQCWSYRPKQRPTFKEIIEMLVPQLDVSFKEKSYFFSDENKDMNDINDEMDEEYPDEPDVPFITNNEVCGAASGGGSPDTLNFMEDDNDVGDEFRTFNPPHPLYNGDDKLRSARYYNTVHNPQVNHFSGEDFLRGGYKHDKSKFAAEPCDCVMLEETNLTDQNHRFSSNSNSAIGSVIGSSDDSKESSKSSNSSYAQMNGIHLANGHVPLHNMRSTKC